MSSQPWASEETQQVLPSSVTWPLILVSHLQPVVCAPPALLPLLIHSCFSSLRRRFPALCAAAGRPARSLALRSRGRQPGRWPLRWRGRGRERSGQAERRLGIGSRHNQSPQKGGKRLSFQRSVTVCCSLHLGAGEIKCYFLPPPSVLWWVPRRGEIWLPEQLQNLRSSRELPLLQLQQGSVSPPFSWSENKLAGGTCLTAVLPPLCRTLVSTGCCRA